MEKYGQNNLPPVIYLLIILLDVSLRANIYKLMWASRVLLRLTIPQLRSLLIHSKKHI